MYFQNHMSCRWYLLTSEVHYGGVKCFLSNATPTSFGFNICFDDASQD